MTGITTKANTVIPKTIRVNAHWDAEAGVWCASSTNLTEVITEGTTIPILVEMITDVVELILLDDGAPAGCAVGVVLTSKQPVMAKSFTVTNNVAKLSALH